MKLEKITRDFIRSLAEPQKKRTSAYDSKGIVTRIEEGIAWVKLAGSKIETPIQMTISAEPGDEVQARIANGTAWLVGNGTSPPTDDKTAKVSYKAAKNADKKATKAQDTADEAYKYAEDVEKAAEDAQSAADAARASASSASEYASRALGNLATVQSVAETLAWITQHGTMTLTSDAEPVPTHVYFVQDANGDYTVNSVKYSIVTEPDPDSMASYYELTIDESLNNYVGTHLALTEEGLWLLPTASGANKILVATGTGSTYTTAGTYIIAKINGIDVILAKYAGSGSQIGQEGQTRLLQDYHSIRMIDEDGDTYFWVSDLRDNDGYLHDEFAGDGSTRVFTLTATPTTNGVKHIYIDDVEYTGSVTIRTGRMVEISSAPADGATVIIVYDSLYAPDAKAFTFGSRGFGGKGLRSFTAGEDVVAAGTNSFAEGQESQAGGIAAHAEGYETNAKGYYSHAEGRKSKANSICAHAEGYHTEAGNYAHAEGYEAAAYGSYSHAAGYKTEALYDYQTVVGRLNSTVDAAFIIGKGEDGTPSPTRSNAFVVSWNGSVSYAGSIGQMSDRRLKEHIGYLGEDAEEFVRSLRPAYYIKDGEHHVGFYAQDVEESDKWDCMIGEMDGYKTLGYTELIAPLVAYCQSLERRIEELEKGE